MVNGINIPIERKSVSNWIKTTKIKTNQQKPNKDQTQTIGYLQGIYFKY